MTNEQIDRLAAEVVMGWKIQGEQSEGGCYRTDDGIHLACVWNWKPTVSWTDAGRILDRMRELGFQVVMGVFADHSRCRFEKFDHASGMIQVGADIETGATELKKAITIAAIRALGGEVPSE